MKGLAEDFPVKVRLKSPLVVRAVQIGQVEKLSETFNSTAATSRKDAIDQGEDDGGSESQTRQGNVNPRRDDQLCPGNLQ